MEKLSDIIFYNIDKSIRTYRIFAQKQLKKNGFNITIDQWMLIRCILENPDISQQEMSNLIFKDNASITRMIELLVKSKHLLREPNKVDRRRVKLIVTDQTVLMINDIQKMVIGNRKLALHGLENEDLEVVNRVMNRIILNCQAK